VGQHDALDGLTQVGPQVPAVSHLDRLRSAGARALGVGTGAVPANDLHPGMLAQPVGEYVCRALLQQINRAAPEEVDQNGAIGATTADRDLALHPLGTDQTNDFYELIVERHRQHSTIITSNREGPEILSMMADQLLGQSALDRLQSAAFELVVEGDSYRQRQRPRLDQTST
jgi:hypothetical protein